MPLPKNSPTDFCRAFIERELLSDRKKKIGMSHWNTMERLIARSDELELVYSELIGAFGYSDKFEGYPPSNSYIWLILELIWRSEEFAKSEIKQTREDLKELSQVNEDIVDLAMNLSMKLRRQDELFEKSGFKRPAFQTVFDLIEGAGSNNYLFESYLLDSFKELDNQYELKYWPTVADLVDEIAHFEYNQEKISHMYLPEKVVTGRASDIKDFVLSFDGRFNDRNGLPKKFKFSNNAMAEIINVVLNLPSDQLASGDAVRLVRNRYAKKV